MTPVALPELPEPHGWLHDARGNDPLTFVRVMPEFLKLCTSSMPVYSHAQIQAAVLAERAAERERIRAALRKHLHISFDLFDEKILPVLKEQ